MKIRIAVLTAILAATAAAQTFRVSGTVVDSESSAPLSRTKVALIGGPAPEQSVITTGNGSFSFDVPQGKYTLLASHRGFGERYGESRSGGSACLIVTGPDLDTTGVVLRWHAPVSIHGRILDESGEAVHGATVELFVETVQAGKKRVVSLGRAESDELGNYSWSALPRGTYYLGAAGAPWYFSNLQASDILTEAGKPPSPYALTYFPGSSDARAATPLVLRPGAEVQADFTLRPASGSTLHFVCPNSSCMGDVALNAIGIGGAEPLVKAISLTETNVIPVVPSGRYVVRYKGPDGNMRKVIEVAGDVTVEIAPKPAPTLLGKVAVLNLHEQPKHPIFVNLLDEETGQAVAVALDSNGRFSWPMVPVSHVRLALSGVDGFFVTQMAVAGATVKDGLIDVVDGAQVRVNITASCATGGLQGFVMNGTKPVPMAMVVLAPAQGSSDPFSFHLFQTDSDGSFDFTTIPVGDYVLFAVDNQELEYANPEAVRPYLTAGKRVRIDQHGVQTERIGLTQAVRN